MVKNELAELKKKLALAQKKNKVQEKKLQKKRMVDAEIKKIKDQLKELNTSEFSKRLKRLSKKKLTKEEAARVGKKVQKGARTLYQKTSWLINKLDKLGT